MSTDNKDISHLTIPEIFNKITDFYLPADDYTSGLYYPGAHSINEVPELLDIVTFLGSEAQTKTKREFSIELIHENKKIIFRGHTIDSVEGKIFIFRKLPSYIPEIRKLGMPEPIVELLLNEKLNNGGLVIVAGETGNGKSTTAASVIAYRLKTFGSFCLTIEDPVELPLQGFYDNPNTKKRGICFQTNVDEDGVEDAIRSSLRCYPAVSNSILFLGETRDPMMASEVLKIAANGHLVFTTLHASDVATALKRFLNLAVGHKNANENEIKSMFSSVFRLMIHQKLIPLKDGSKKIEAKILFSPSNTSQVANKIKSGNIDMLSTEIENQNSMLSKGLSILESRY